MASSSTKEINAKTSGLKTSTKFFYAMGEFPGGYLTTLISFFFLIYLTDFVGISPGWAGGILFVGFVFDGITDPLAGYFSDRTTSKFGRRRIYMLITAIPLGLTFLLLFTMPSLARLLPQAAKIAIVLVVYLIYIVMYTFYTTPYFAIINDITDNYDERTSLMSWRMSLSILAILIAVIIPDFFGLSDVQTFTAKGFAITGAIFAALVTISALISVFGMKERPGITVEKRKFSIKEYLFDSWKCAPFRQACLCYFFSFAALATINTCMIYYLNYFLQLPQLFLPIAAGVMIMAIAFLPFWNFMCQKIGKKKSQIIGAIIISIGLIILAMVKPGIGGAIGNPGDLTTINLSMVESLKKFPVIAYVATVLISMGFSALQMVSSAIVPDAINFSCEKDRSNEGSFYGVVTLIFKIGTGIAALIIGLVLEWTNYIKPPTSLSEGQIMIQPVSAQTGILVVFVVLPCIMALLSIVSLLRYKVDRDTLSARTKETHQNP